MCADGSCLKNVHLFFVVGKSGDKSFHAVLLGTDEGIQEKIAETFETHTGLPLDSYEVENRIPSILSPTEETIEYIKTMPKAGTDAERDAAVAGARAVMAGQAFLAAREAAEASRATHQ